MCADHRPNPEEYAEYYQGYIGQVPEGPILARLETQVDKLQRDLLAVDEVSANFRYQEGKWSARQVLGHMTDVEAVFAYRALAIARGDSQAIPGMDQDAWMEASPFEQQTWRQLIDNLIAQRRVTLSIFCGLSDQDWDRTGVASDCRFTVRSIAWILAGHWIHHKTILRDRYQIGD